MGLFGRTYGRTRRARSARRGFPWHFAYGALALLGTALIAYGVWSLTRLPYFTISTITVTGGTTVSHEALRDAAAQELAGTYVFLIPKRFSYAYPHDRIVTRLSSIPRVRSVSVTRAGLDELDISFDEYMPHALWCAGDGTRCVFLDENGYAFADAPLLKGSAFVRYMTPSREPKTGETLFDASRMHDTELFIDALMRELGFRSQIVTITEDDDFEYELVGGGSIFVAGATDVQDAFDNLRSVLEAPEFSDLAPGTFNYIDLRFGNRVFVKQEQEAPETSEGESLPEDE